ncbi:MAG: hypothetical protein U9P49_12565 [Thermodesulfobacteriota bacterium]|nr:hypothetical protein [Thermodesulfobacteriota bacterium]
MKFEHVKVKTRDEGMSPGRPRYIVIDGKIVEIADIEHQWREAYRDSSWYPMEYFRVRTRDDKRYILRYSTLFKSWGITQYK